jgi:hypothetical protein
LLDDSQTSPTDNTTVFSLERKMAFTSAGQRAQLAADVERGVTVDDESAWHSAYI